MPEEVDSGRLYLEVAADATGLRRDLRTKLTAAAEGLRAKIAVELDDKRLAAQARAAARTASQVAVVKAQVTFDAKQARTALNKALREAKANTRVRVPIAFDAAKTRRDLNATLKEAAAGVRAPKIDLNVGADTGRARTNVEEFRREQESHSIKIKADADPSSLNALGKALSAAGGMLATLSTAPAIASGITVLAGAAVNAAGALFSMAAAASQAGGLLAALPGLAAVGAQGLAAAIIGFSGVGKAVQALQKQQTSAASTAKSTAATQAAAAEQIRAARERLKVAQENAAAGVANAERNLKNAHDAERQAQQALTKARKEAADALVELAFDVRQANLSEAQAEIDLQHAQARYTQMMQSVTATALDKQQAELDLKQAQLNLDEARKKQADLTQEQKRADKAGVEGSDQVKAAKKALLQAQQQETDAEKALAKARRDGARQVADAQRAVQQAMRQTGAAAGGAAAGVNAVGAAMNGLSPAAQRFARFLVGTVFPRLRELRNSVATALLPPLQRGITAALPLLDTVQKQLTRTGAIVGDVGERFGKWAGSAPFRRDTATIMGANNVALEHFGNAGLFLADALRHVMVVASPLVIRFSELAERWAKGADQAAKTGRETGRMADFFDRAWATGAKLWHIVRDLAVALFNLGRAARPSGDTLLDSLARAADHLRQWTADPANQARIQSFFENTVPLARNLGDLLNRIVGLLIRLGQATGGHTLDGLFKVLNTFVTLLDKIADMPGGGTVLSTILLLSGAGLGLGLVAKFIGSIVGNLGKLSKYSGTSKLLGLLTGGRAGRGKNKTSLGDLADDAARMGGAIDDELPKDKKKSTALDLVGQSAGGARKPMRELEGGVKAVGTEAEKGAVKSGLFARILSRIGSVAKGVAGPLGKIGGLLLALPGTGKLTGLLSKIKLPKLSVGGGGEGGALSGLRGFFGGVGRFLEGEAVILAGKAGSVWRAVGRALTTFRPPALTGVLSRVGTWVKGLSGGITRVIAGAFKGGGKGLVERVGIGAAKGGARGGSGGPLGLIGGILAGVIGELIGGGHGGVRGGIGGGISGAATGAGVGGLIGSIFPGIGTTIGAVLGGVVGAVIGAITGGHWWGAVGTFFTKTLPTFLLDQIKRVPGLVVKGLEGLLDLGDALGQWLLRGLAKLPGLAGKGLGWALKTIPPMIVDIFFTAVEYALKGAFRLPNIFGWMLNMALKIGPKLYIWIEKLPFTLAKLAVRAALNAPNAFSWLNKQADVAVKKLPHIFDGMWKSISQGNSAGLTKTRQIIARHLGNIGKDFQKQSRRFVLYLAAAWIRTVNGARTGLRGAVSWVGRHLSSIRTAFASAGRYVGGRISAAMSAVGRYIRSGLKSAGGYASRGLSSVRSTFSSAAKRLGTTVRNLFTRTIPDLARSGMSTTWKRINGVLSTIKSGFRTAVSAIGKTWTGLESKLMAPVRWIGKNVYTGGIKKIWDLVASKVKMSPLPKLPGFATGGIYGALPGYTPGRDVLNVPAVAMSGGEAIMRPEWTRAVGSGFVDFFNRLARTGGVKAVRQAMQAMTGGAGFSTGGIVPRPVAAFAGGGIFGAISDGWHKFTDAAKSLFGGGLKTAANWVLNPILNAVSGAMAPAGAWGTVLGKFPPMMAKAFIDYLVKFIEPKLGGDPLGVVAQAKKFIGIGDDRGPNNNQWTRGWGMPGAPWCAMFVSDMIHRAHAEKHYSGYPTALAAGYNSMKHVSQGRPGDLATYNNGGHINIIEKANGGYGQGNPGGGYWTIGGNQNALVQRGIRYPQVILRPTGNYATGGVLADTLRRGAKRLFFTEAPRQFDKHEMNTPLVRLIRSLNPNMADSVLKALMDSKLMVTDKGLDRDTGGVIPPGRHVIDNNTGVNEWALNPEAIRLLGGERAVASLNAGAARVRRAAVSSPRAAASTAAGVPGGDPTVNVYPQPKQSETEIGMIAARKLGAMLK